MSNADLRVCLIVSVLVTFALSIVCTILFDRCLNLMEEVSGVVEANAQLAEDLRRERILNRSMRIEVDHIARLAGVRVPPINTQP